MSKYMVMENKEKSANPENVFSLWLGENWMEKVGQLEALPNNNVLSLYRPAKRIKVYWIE